MEGLRLKCGSFLESARDLGWGRLTEFNAGDLRRAIAVNIWNLKRPFPVSRQEDQCRDKDAYPHTKFANQKYVLSTRNTETNVGAETEGMVKKLETHPMSMNYY